MFERRNKRSEFGPEVFCTRRFSAKFRIEKRPRSPKQIHRTTFAARASTLGGIVTLISLAVFKLNASSTSSTVSRASLPVGCRRGFFARIWPTACQSRSSSGRNSPAHRRRPTLDRETLLAVFRPRAIDNLFRLADDHGVGDIEVGVELPRLDLCQSSAQLGGRLTCCSTNLMLSRCASPRPNLALSVEAELARVVKGNNWRRPGRNSLSNSSRLPVSRALDTARR